jgi:mono/diheme cytochrome c family protein
MSKTPSPWYPCSWIRRGNLSALLRCCLSLLISLSAAVAVGQNEDDEQPPGLRARYQVNDAVVERVDEDLAFQWGQSPPDARLPSGKFSANWSGTLLLRSAETYQFHAFAQGRVRLKVNGQTLLEGEAETAGWFSGPATSLSFGDQPFEVTYERTGDEGQLQLFWSSNEFPLEPVPYHSLFQTKASPELSLVEQGRIQFDAYRCGNCHGSRLDPNRLQAPSLKHVGSGTSREWLIDKLMRSGAPTVVEGEKMPHFGFNRSEAESIVAALVSQATVPEFVAAAKQKESDRAKDLPSGRTLVNSLGCLACHTWHSLGEVTPFGGANLDAIGEKRSSEWLSTWLQSPGRLNLNHRMPVFSLTEKERSQIVLALVESSQPFDHGKSAVGPPIGASIEQGRKLIAAARCAHCHDLPGATNDVTMVAPLTKPDRDWKRSCTAPLDRTQNRPEFPGIDAAAIKAYCASWKRDSSHAEHTVEDSQFGRRLLERKNCTSCHDRDGARGISKHAAAIAKTDEALSGLHMTLIPPRLNAVGDRMRDTALAEAIRGEQKSPRLNWLRVRMPKFAHSDVEQSALLKYLVDHDRIPAGGPVVEQAVEQIPEKPDAQQILAGRELLGGKGFSCVACHAVKEYTPKVTALGTRGSNLHLIGQRMRSEYFFRWTRAPLRVMPGVEMPNYQRPHEYILPGQLNQQLVAIWQALNDPNLTAPTNPAVVEQLLTVSSTDQPKVVRDVFTVPGSPDETVSRSYAAGLPGGHSILFDLETGSLRGWTLGDFARQRCEGKRWYWDLAGTTLAAGFEKRPDIFLVDAKTRQMLGPETGWTVEYSLHTDQREDRYVELHYDVKVSKEDLTFSLNVVERWEATAEGWERRITATAPAGTEVWFRNSTPKIHFNHSQIKVERSPQARESQLPAEAIAFWNDPESNRQVMKASYETSLRWEFGRQAAVVSKLSPADKVTSVPGFDGRRLAFPRSIMPTALAWDHRQRLMFTSLKGDLYRQESADDQQSLSVVEGGLAAPFGLIEIPNTGAADPAERQFSIVVAHKPELLNLKLDKLGQVQARSVLASGWGVTDDYHDWTCGIVRDSLGNLFVGLGSDYTFKNRPKANSRWRGDILRIEPDGKIESIAHGLRYPTGLAIDGQDRLFCSDQQGVQNTFNELNLIQVGHRYGVPSRHEISPDAPADAPAVQIPHPWTRSVNGIVWVPKSDTKALAPFAGQFLACEFNNHSLIRMSVQTVGDVVQGAAYAFSRPAKEGDSSNFVGPLCIGLSPVGEIYVGGLQDGGWAGGLNVGDIVKLTSNGELPNGIREIRATKSGFDVEFFHPIDPNRAAETGQFKISGYTRVWKGDYATPDSGNHACEVQPATLSADKRTVALIVSGRKLGHVYDVSVGEIGSATQRVLWPSIGHYTLHQIPD